MKLMEADFNNTMQHTGEFLTNMYVNALPKEMEDFSLGGPSTSAINTAVDTALNSVITENPNYQPDTIENGVNLSAIDRNTEIGTDHLQAAREGHYGMQFKDTKEFDGPKAEEKPSFWSQMDWSFLEDMAKEGDGISRGSASTGSVSRDIPQWIMNPSDVYPNTNLQDQVLNSGIGNSAIDLDSFFKIKKVKD